MGACLSVCQGDLFQKLWQEYGDEFVKKITAEKAKQTVEQKFEQFTKKTSEIFNNFQNRVTDITQKKSQSLQNNFESAKNKVNQVFPGGIAALQRKKGQSINQFSGYNKLQGYITNIKDRTLQKVSRQRTDAMTKIGNKKNDVINKIKQQQPKIPLYDDLPAPIKKQILDKGEQKFKQQVSQNKQKYAQIALNQMTSENFQGIFNRINPSDEMENVVQNSMKSFLDNLGIGGGFGGFIDKIF